MPNPYGITEVDVAGALNGYQAAQTARIRNMVLQRQIEAEDRQLERQSQIQRVLAQALNRPTGGQQGSSGTQNPALPAAAPGMSEPPAPAAPAAPVAAAAPSTPNIDMRRLGADLLAIDVQQGAQILQAFRQMDEAANEQSQRANLTLARAAQHLLSLPEAERPAEIQRIAPSLAQQGITQDQIAGFQPTNRNLEFLVTQARDIERIREEARPRLREVAGELIDERVLPSATPENPVVFESEFINTPQGMYRRSDLTGGGGRQPQRTPEQLRADAAEAIRQGADSAQVNARLEQMLRQGGPQASPSAGNFPG